MKSLLVKLGFILIGLSIFGYTEVWGADWKFYGTSSDGEFFYDSKSIYSQEDNIVRVVSKIVFSEGMKKDLIKQYGKTHEGVTHFSFIYEFNCQDKKYRTLEYNICSGENLSLGPIPIIRGGPIDSGWRSFARRSPIESLYKIVCK